MHIGQRLAFRQRHPEGPGKNFIAELKARCHNDLPAMCRQVIGNDDQFRSLLKEEHDFRKWLGIDKECDYTRRRDVPLLALAKAAVLADNPRRAGRALVLLEQVAVSPSQARGTDFAEAVAYLRKYAGNVPEFKNSKAGKNNRQLADAILAADEMVRQRLPPSSPSTARLLQLRGASGSVAPNVKWERKTDPAGPSPIQNDFLEPIASNVATGSFGAVSFFKDGTGKRFIGKTVFPHQAKRIRGDTLGYELQAHETLHAWVRDHAGALSEKDRIALSNIPKAYGIANIHGKRTLLMELIPGKKEGVEAFQHLYFHWQEGHISSEEYWGAIQFLARRLFDMANLLVKANIAHNDFKPENFMVDIHTGEPKLIDFGGWSKVGDTAEAFTIDYAAQELLQPARKSTATADAHSVGRTILAGVNGDMGRNDAKSVLHDFERLRPVEKTGTAYRQFLDKILSNLGGDRLRAQHAEFLTDSVLGDEGAKDVIKAVLTETTKWHKEHQRKRDSGENLEKHRDFLAAPSSIKYQELLALAPQDNDLLGRLRQSESREAVIKGIEQEYQELLGIQREMVELGGSRDPHKERVYRTKVQAFLRRVSAISRGEKAVGIRYVRHHLSKEVLDMLGQSIGATAKGVLHGSSTATSDRVAASSYRDKEELRADTNSLIAGLGQKSAQDRSRIIEQRLAPEKLQQIAAHTEDLQKEMRRMAIHMAEYLQGVLFSNGGEYWLAENDLTESAWMERELNLYKNNSREYMKLKNEVDALQTILAPAYQARRQAAVAGLTKADADA